MKRLPLHLKTFLLLPALSLLFAELNAQRKLHYKPDGNSFVKVSGERKFNRALYGTNTGFRVETSDLPEFALYMPGMGGNLRFFLRNGNRSKPLTKAGNIQTIYSPGSMEYIVKDELFGSGQLHIKAAALAEKEGLILEMSGVNMPASLEIYFVYGGATGKKFSRDGDIGADPESSFYLKPEYCTGNTFMLNQQAFRLLYGAAQQLNPTEYETLLAEKKAKALHGIFPGPITLGDATNFQDSLKHGSEKNAPVVYGSLSGLKQQQYILLYNPGTERDFPGAQQLPSFFKAALLSATTLANRVQVETPDPYLNTLGGTLSTAADAIWEDPTFLHGAVAWRMRLNAWRGAYAADPLGWHDRAQKHFSSYAQSQVTVPLTGPVVADTALHLARQQEKIGNSLFSNGYICRNPNGDIRPHHYDMNLVFIDQLFTHFNWTGDTAFMRQMWPVIERHLAWEKRNFDADNDGLYDAYCCIWASDALQYSGGGVAHSSAYNYRANKLAAVVAKKLGIPYEKYEQEATKIHAAVNKQLWIADKEWFAEYIDGSGNKLVHPSAGLWTVYHLMESGLPDPTQATKTLRYVDNHIPHIPIETAAFKPGELFLLATTNWQPYTWSINNVALAEILHTSLAYWQGQRKEKAYQLWRSALIESMYFGASPGGFQQLSYYDAFRGELYRDFADPIGMAARSLVEGLFGIKPEALKDTLFVEPGFPAEWNHAKLRLPLIDMSYRKEGNKETYHINQRLQKQLHLELKLPARGWRITKVMVNGKAYKKYTTSATATYPQLSIKVPQTASYQVEIFWEETLLPQEYSAAIELNGKHYTLNREHLPFDMNTLREKTWSLPAVEADKTVFYTERKGDFQWNEPVFITVKTPVSISVAADGFSIINRSNMAKEMLIWVNGKEKSSFSVKGKTTSERIILGEDELVAGTNTITLKNGDGTVLAEEKYINWKVPFRETNRHIPVAHLFNSKVTDIFTNNYLSPRPATPTLQLPTQGIGNWCYPLVLPVINDSGIREKAGASSVFKLSSGLSFTTPSDTGKNIVFTSMWDNYPDSISLPLSGKAAHAYLLMTGSTSPMQSQLVNGYISIEYTDGSSTKLELKNPETWWPIEQDYLHNGGAFFLSQPAPPRISLQTGKEIGTNYNYSTIKGFSNRAIEGGAATVLDLPLDSGKTLSKLTVRTLANDVVIGLMGVTLAQ
ncbi:MAG: DUF4450 domain-containing protein [Chitinophagaceae bacterium]